MTFKESIEKLKENGYVEDADALEKAWSAIEVDEMFSKMKQVKEIIGFIDTFVFSVNQKLANQRGLETLEREYELGRKDAMLAIKNLFNPDNFAERREGVKRELQERSEDN
jgi:cob(I)alamin adenosyltransferase